MNRAFTRTGLEGTNDIELTQSVMQGIADNLKNKDVGFIVTPEPILSQGDEINCTIDVGNEEVSVKIALCLNRISSSSARFSSTVPEELSPWLSANDVNEAFENAVTKLVPSNAK